MTLPCLPGSFSSIALAVSGTLRVSHRVFSSSQLNLRPTNLAYSSCQNERRDGASHFSLVVQSGRDRRCTAQEPGRYHPSSSLPCRWERVIQQPSSLPSRHTLPRGAIQVLHPVLHPWVLVVPLLPPLDGYSSSCRILVHNEQDWRAQKDVCSGTTAK